MYEKLMKLMSQGGGSADDGRQETADIQQPTEFGGREAPFETSSPKIKFSLKAKKLLKKKLEADAKLEKELRKQEPVDLLEDEDEELATMPINVLGPR